MCKNKIALNKEITIQWYNVDVVLKSIKLDCSHMDSRAKGNYQNLDALNGGVSLTRRSCKMVYIKL